MPSMSTEMKIFLGRACAWTAICTTTRRTRRRFMRDDYTVRRQNTAIAYQLVGWTMRAVAVIAIFSAVLLPVGVALIAASYWVIRRGKKHAAAVADDVLAEDTRPPVLYLRSFNDEE